MKAATDSSAIQEIHADARFEQILGIRFFNGTAAEAVQQSLRGGLVVAPSGTCFERFMCDADYRRAIISAEVALPDSGLMVTLWRLLRRRPIQRISGLAYLKTLLDSSVLGPATIWVLPNERSRTRLLQWSAAHGHAIGGDDCYLAPIYGAVASDEKLLALIEARTPRHIVIAIGAGAQEKLGWYLRRHAAGRPAIHCIGGALGFLTGDQVAIPDWADRLYLGWLLRLLSQPRAFVPRLWKARVLPRLLLKYGEHLPPLAGPKM